MPCRLYEQVQVLGRAVREAAQVEALQDVQRLQCSDRACRRGGAEQLISPIGGPGRIEHLRLVVGQVLRTQDAAVSPHLLVEGGRDLAPVQAVPALPTYPFERIGQVALDDSRAGCRGTSVRQEYARGLGVPGQLGHEHAAHQARGDVRTEPFPGVVHRRLQQLLERQGAE